MVSEKQLAEFTAGYITALLWSSVLIIDEECIDADVFELSTAGADRCRADCLDFCNGYARLLKAATAISGYTWGDAGHDFALTRNGHGAGFWDREPLKVAGLGDALTEAARLKGETCLFLNDSNEVEIS